MLTLNCFPKQLRISLAILFAIVCADAQADEKLQLIDFKFKGQNVRSVWSAQKHKTGEVTFVVMYWPRSNQPFVGMKHMSGRVERDSAGVCIDFYNSPGSPVERFHVGSSKKNKIGLQITKSLSPGSSGSIKDAGEYSGDGISELSEALGRLHIAFRAYLERKAISTNATLLKINQSFNRTVLEAANGWIEVGN